MDEGWDIEHSTLALPDFNIRSVSPTGGAVARLMKKMQKKKTKKGIWVLVDQTSKVKGQAIEAALAVTHLYVS